MGSGKGGSASSILFPFLLAGQNSTAKQAMNKKQLFFLILFPFLISSPFISPCHADLGTAARLSPPSIPTGCGFDLSQFPSSNMFAAAGEGIWDDGAACGRQYLVSCTSAATPGTCIPGQTIQVMIVGRALTLASRPSREGTLMVLSGTAFKAIATTSAVSVNIDFEQV